MIQHIVTGDRRMCHDGMPPTVDDIFIPCWCRQCIGEESRFRDPVGIGPFCHGCEAAYEHAIGALSFLRDHSILALRHADEAQWQTA